MSFHLIECGKCGKQYMKEKPEDTCYWCNEPETEAPKSKIKPGESGMNTTLPRDFRTKERE